MKKILLMFALAVTSMAFSMSAQGKSDINLQVSEGRIMESQPQLMFKPVVAEVEVDTSKGKIHDVWNLTLDELESRSVRDNDAATIDNLKAYGIFKSSEKNNCDIIVTPLFDIAITSRGATINVIGFPGHFRNWNTATETDIKLCQQGNKESNENANPDIIKKIK